jgi:L-iditol 2-dehydrogenase
MHNRAAIMYGTHDIRLEEVPVPEPAPREVLVEIEAVGVCGSDVHYYEEGRIGSFVVREPLILGHESMGTIIGLGEEVTKHEVGERVTLEPGVPDGTCRECRAGRYNLCPNVQFFATPPVNGAFTNYVNIHEDFAFALPDGLSDNAGALMEPLSVGIWACRKAKVEAGSPGRARSGSWRCKWRSPRVRRRSRSPTSPRSGWIWPRRPGLRVRSTCRRSRSPTRVWRWTR